MGLDLYLSHEFIKLIGKFKTNNKITILINLILFKGFIIL